MRALIQRVSEAGVTVAEEKVSSIGKGVLVLLGVAHEDGSREVKWMVDKICNLRIFEDDDEKMNLSLLDVGGEALVVSQFTLYGDCRKGRRPSFVKAARPEQANQLYEEFVSLMKERVPKVGTGVFQTTMKVGLVNDGPVTIWLETPEAS